MVPVVEKNQNLSMWLKNNCRNGPYDRKYIAETVHVAEIHYWNSPYCIILYKMVPLAEIHYRRSPFGVKYIAETVHVVEIHYRNSPHDIISLQNSPFKRNTLQT